MDYMLNPLICVIWCSKAAGNIIPEIPYALWAVGFALFFTLLNLRGVRTTARINEGLAAGMAVVIVIFMVAAVRYLLHVPHDPGFFSRPFYDPRTFSGPAVFTGTSIAVLTYIGFDGISTLSEEAENPKRNILLATVLVCVITGVLASIQVYAAQLVWPATTPFPDVDTAYVHVAGRVGGYGVVSDSQFHSASSKCGFGNGGHSWRPRACYMAWAGTMLSRNRFFGVIEAKHGIPRNNVLFVGAIALTGAFLLSYQLGAELLNFGAFIAFMGVNAAAFMHYYWRVERSDRRMSNLIPPVLGFVICFFIWLNLRWQAQLAGAVWLAIGIAYGMYKTKGFREMLNFDVVPE